MDADFMYKFPSIRGVQARREYYISMCPLRLIPRLFSFDEVYLPPELRAQRVLNKARIPEMSKYILNGRDSYVFSAITVSIDAKVEFEPLPLPETTDSHRLGMLKIPMDAKFIINDGQHRRAAIEAALKDAPEIGDETIAVVFFLDIGLERCQQMFADLNRYAIRPSTSLGVLYDHRDGRAVLTKQIVFKSPIFKDLVELEKTTLPQRSRKLFTLSSIHTATKALVAGREDEPIENVAILAFEYWEAVASLFPEWQLVREHKIPAGKIRSEFIHSHAITLQALGIIGNELLTTEPKGWKKKLSVLKNINWRRENTKIWEGRAMIGGRISKAGQNVALMVNFMKITIGLPLKPEEQRAESAFKRGNRG